MINFTQKLNQELEQIFFETNEYTNENYYSPYEIIFINPLEDKKRGKIRKKYRSSQSPTKRKNIPNPKKLSRKSTKGRKLF